MVDRAQYHEKSRETWSKMAAGWTRNRGWMWDVSRPVGEDLVAKLDPQPGQTILELAAGTGDTGFAAAKAVGDSGRLISTDFSEQMVAAARDYGRELDLPNVEYRVMDAERMDLADDSVDGVLCRWGYMLMANPQAAMAETRRVLRDGGRLAFSVWGDPRRNPWASMPRVALAGHMPQPGPADPGIFALADHDKIRSLVRGAGFSKPEITEVEVEYRFEDFDQYWRFLNEMAGAIAAVVEALSDDERAAAQAQLRDLAADYRDNGSYRMPGMCVNAVTS